MSGNCPYCNAEWPAEGTDCPNCGVLLDRWLKQQAREPSQAPRAARLPGRLAGLLAAALLAAAATGAFLLEPGKGLPIGNGYHVDPEAGFAAAAPAGFTAEWPAAAPEASGQRLLARFSGPSADGTPPEMSILSLARPAVKVTPERGEELADGCFGWVRASAGRWSPGYIRVMKVDQLDSLRVEGSGSRPGGQDVPAIVRASTLEVFVGGVLVPGRDRSYLLSYVCDKRQESLCLPAFEGLVASFRVLKRPRPLDFLTGS